MTTKGHKFNVKNSNTYRFDTGELNYGINLCIKKTKQLLNASRLLANDKQYLSYALGLYIFALEEYGKSRLLEKGRSPTGSHHLIHKKVFGFGDRNSHRKKIREGTKKLSSNMIKVETGIDLIQNLTEKTRTVALKDDKIKVSIGPSQTGIFSSKDQIDIQEDIRWRCFHVDWDNEERYWKYEFTPKKVTFLS